MESGFLTISIFTFRSVETFIESEDMNNISCLKLLNNFFFKFMWGNSIVELLLTRDLNRGMRVPHSFAPK